MLLTLVPYAREDKVKTSNITQVTDTLYFIMLYRVHLTMGSEKYQKER